MGLRLTINGEQRELENLQPGASLQQVVAALALSPDRIAVERNGDIVRRSVWGTLAMQEMDRLEVVHFVGGGLAASASVAECG